MSDIVKLVADEQKNKATLSRVLSGKQVFSKPMPLNRLRYELRGDNVAFSIESETKEMIDGKSSYSVPLESLEIGSAATNEEKIEALGNLDIFRTGEVTFTNNVVQSTTNYSQSLIKTALLNPDGSPALSVTGKQIYHQTFTSSVPLSDGFVKPVTGIHELIDYNVILKNHNGLTFHEHWSSVFHVYELNGEFVLENSDSPPFNYTATVFWTEAAQA
ncbi:MAG: hypothetical protein AAF599_00155 [Bacteroidota bacterium]